MAKTREILTEGYQRDTDDILTSVDIEEVRRIRVKFDIKERIRVREQQKELTYTIKSSLKTLFRICPFQALGFMAGMVVPVGLLLYITLYVSCRYGEH